MAIVTKSIHRRKVTELKEHPLTTFQNYIGKENCVKIGIFDSFQDNSALITGVRSITTLDHLFLISVTITAKVLTLLRKLLEEILRSPMTLLSDPLVGATVAAMHPPLTALVPGVTVVESGPS